MVTISLVSQKGGAGKSTIAANLGAALHVAGWKTLLVDCDPQRSLLSWSSVAASRNVEGPPVVGMNGASLVRDLRSVAEPYDAVVIDTPGRLSAETRGAIVAADVTLVPCCCGPSDFWAAQATVALLEEARAMRPELRAFGLLNRYDKRTSLARLAEKTLPELGLETIGVALGQRTAYGEAFGAGEGVVTFAPASDAAAEMRRLVRAVVDVVTPAVEVAS